MGSTYTPENTVPLFLYYSVVVPANVYSHRCYFIEVVFQPVHNHSCDHLLFRRDAI